MFLEDGLEEIILGEVNLVEMELVGLGLGLEPREVVVGPDAGEVVEEDDFGAEGEVMGSDIGAEEAAAARDEDFHSG